MLPQLLLMLAFECVYIETRVGRLEVVAVDVLGERVPETEAELYSDNKLVMRMAKGKRLGNVPYGNYRIRIWASGFYSVWQHVRVAQAETVIRVQLDVSFECGPSTYTVAGHIKQGRPKSDLWVKAIPIRGVGGFETRVYASGRFSLSGLPGVDYLLLVIDGNTVVHQRTVKANQESAALVMDLSTLN